MNFIGFQLACRTLQASISFGEHLLCIAIDENGLVGTDFRSHVVGIGKGVEAAACETAEGKKLHDPIAGIGISGMATRPFMWRVLSFAVTLVWRLRSTGGFAAFEPFGLWPAAWAPLKNESFHFSGKGGKSTPDLAYISLSITLKNLQPAADYKTFLL